MSPTERSILLAGLQGQKVCIPDLHPVFCGWPQDVNKNMASIKTAINEILESNAYNESISAKLQEEDLALLISSWWPYADLETLLDLTQFVSSIFTVDSVVDRASGTGRDKIEAFQDLHQSTNNFVEQKLNQSPQEKVLSSSNAALKCFQVLNGLLHARYTAEQSKMFLDEAKFTMEMLAVQQKLRIKGRIPNLEEYCSYREGSCCINAMIALVEYGNNLRLPIEVMHDPDMLVLKKEATRANWITNDIVSVKKELASGFVENLVVLCASDGRAQTGVTAAVNLLRSAVERFEAAASNLALRYAAEELLANDIATFVNGCRCLCMGSYKWSLVSKRYGLEEGRNYITGDTVIVL